MDLDQIQHLVPNIIFFVDRKCYPDWEIVRQKIGFHDLTFVVKGRSTYIVDGVEYHLEAGDVIYIPMGSVREAHTSKDNPMHSFAFNFNWLPSGAPIRLPLQTMTKNVMSEEILEYIRQFSHAWLSRQSGYVMKTRALFMLIIHRLITMHSEENAGQQVDRRVSKVMEYISEHFAEDLDVHKIAALVDLNPVYMGKLFKKHTGHSFRKYLNIVRVNQAEMLLSTGGFTVSEVVERCGFQDVSYFSKVFKSIKGFPPSRLVR